MKYAVLDSPLVTRMTGGSPCGTKMETRLSTSKREMTSPRRTFRYSSRRSTSIEAHRNVSSMSEGGAARSGFLVTEDQRSMVKPMVERLMD